jgi:hypothetical protein
MQPIDLIARMPPGGRSRNDGNGLAVMQPRLDAMTSEGRGRSDLRLCEPRGITKTFGGTVACRNVDFEVKRGEVHALVGEMGGQKHARENTPWALPTRCG